MISPSEISVIVQGAVLGDPWQPIHLRPTCRAVEAARATFPGAQIVVSTWQDANVVGLDFDHLVRSADPGPQPLRIERGQTTLNNNLNRQIVSTLAGLRAARTKYALKIRSDVLVHHAGFLKKFGTYQARDPEYSILKERLLSPGFHARAGLNRNPVNPCLFHPSDWICFGRTDDLIEVWDVPLQSEDDATWFVRNPKSRSAFDHTDHVSRWIPEAYVWSKFLAKHVPLAYDSYLDHSEELAAVSERSFAANLVFLDPRDMDFTALKYPDMNWRIRRRGFRERFTHRDWLLLYKRFCDASVTIPVRDRAHADHRKQVFRRRVRLVAFRAKQKLKSLGRKLILG